VSQEVLIAGVVWAPGHGLDLVRASPLALAPVAQDLLPTMDPHPDKFPEGEAVNLQPEDFIKIPSHASGKDSFFFFYIFMSALRFLSFCFDNIGRLLTFSSENPFYVSMSLVSQE